MEQLHNGFTLRLCEGAFPLSTDSMLLAHFTRLPRQARVLDLGSGCGTLGLLLCARDGGCHVSGIELDPAAHEAALENIARNGISHRMESICADLTHTREILAAGSYSVCVSNPPYFSAGPASSSTPLARRDDRCSMAQLMRSAAWALKYGGDFCLVHKPERLAELIACACAVHLEPKQLCLVRHHPEAPVSLILVRCRKGAKPGLALEELCLHNADGSPTELYQQIYNL